MKRTMTSSMRQRVSTKYSSCAFLTRSSSSRRLRFLSLSSGRSRLFSLPSLTTVTPSAPASSYSFSDSSPRVRHSILSALRVR